MVARDEGGEYDGIMLWLLFLGGIAGGDEAGRGWIEVGIREQTGKLGLVRWDELRGFLRRFPWIGAVHDEGGKALWDAVEMRG